MMAKKRILSWLVAASLALNLVPATALAAGTETQETEKTLSEEILAPGKEDIIDKANDNAQDLIDDTYNALNPVDKTTDPSAEPAENMKVGDILKTDEETQETKVEGDVLTKAETAAENVGKTKSEVEAKLTVEVEVETEGGETKTEKKPVDEVVADEAAKAELAKTAAEDAANRAAAAVEAEDEAALAQAKTDAAQAVIAANEAYDNAQKAFDSVIDNLLDEADKAAVAEKVAEALKDVAVPGEDATDEEKAAYETLKLNTENAAKLDAANAKIDSKYTAVNTQVKAAKTALETAQTALTNAKGAYDEAVATAKNDATGVDIDAYVKMFEDLQADEDTAKKVANAYGAVDTAKGAADTAAKDADDGSGRTIEERMADSQATISDRDRWIEGTGKWNPNLVAAANFVSDRNKTIADNLKKIQEAGPNDDTTAYWNAIDQAQDEIETKTFYYYDDGSYAESQKFAWDEGGTNVVSALSASATLKWWSGEYHGATGDVKSACDQLLKDLTAAEAAREQMKAEEALKKTLAGLSNLSYQEAIKVVKGFATIKDCDALKDAQERYDAQKDAADKAQAKVDEATKAYKAAEEAVKKALQELEGLMKNQKLDNAAFEAAKAKLSDAKDKLDDAKKDKEDAEDEKKKADEAVIETEDEIRDIIDTTGDPDDGDTGDDDTAIADGLVPLALMPTRGELMNYLYVRAGSPAAELSTFTDVPADHEFALAIGWAQANGIANGYADGTFDPDNFVIVRDMTAFLTNYARYAGMTMPTLSTMAGLEEDAIVETADEILAEFFGD